MLLSFVDVETHQVAPDNSCRHENDTDDRNLRRRELVFEERSQDIAESDVATPNYDENDHVQNTFPVVEHRRHVLAHVALEHDLRLKRESARRLFRLFSLEDED